MDYFKISIFLIYVNIVLASDISHKIYCTQKSQLENCTSDIPFHVKARMLDNNNINSPIQYDEIDICKADNTAVLSENSSLALPFDIKFLKPQKCSVICTKTYVGGLIDDDNKLRTMKDAILNNYRHHWYVENIPALWCHNKDGKMSCETGFPMGCYFNKNYSSNSSFCNGSDLQADTGYLLFNHVNIKITFQSKDKITSGFSLNGLSGNIKNIKVLPTSVHHQDPYNLNCKSEEPIYLPKGSIRNGTALKITYSYSVFFEMDNYIPPKSNETDSQVSDSESESDDSSVPKINLTLMTFSIMLFVNSVISSHIPS